MLSIPHSRLIPGFLSAIFFTSPIQIFLFPPSHSLMSWLFQLCSLSAVSLGCILHCPNSPKFHDFCCCPNSAQLNPNCSFYQQCVYCPFQGMNVAYKPHGTRCLPVPPHPIPQWHSSCCSSSAPALKLRLWSCPTPTQGSVHLEMPLCLLIHSGALILLPPSGLPLPSAACPRLPLLSFWAVMV